MDRIYAIAVGSCLVQGLLAGNTLGEIEGGEPTMTTEYVIRPWIHDGIENPDMNVPPEVESIAHEVLNHYDLQVHDMTLITSKSDKGGAIWQVNTNRGKRSLKVLHREPDRSLFSIHAQEYLVNQGARVPRLIRTLQDDMYVNAGGKSWIVTDWIEPLTQVSKVDLEGAKELCYALGEFHRLSRGYNPPPEAHRATRLYRWPKTYEKVHTKIGWFRTLAKVYSDLPGSAALLSVVDQFEQQAASAISRLHDSPYFNLTSLGESYWGIVHQDYGWSNGQKGPDGMWIIDLDGVAFDLPIRDLRKLIGSTMNDMGRWDAEWARGMIEAYHEACPMEQELYAVLLIDLSLPNEFYKDVKEIVYDPTLFLTSEIVPLLERLSETDKTKWPVLEELSANKSFKKMEFSVPLLSPLQSSLGNQSSAGKGSDISSDRWTGNEAVSRSNDGPSSGTAANETSMLNQEESGIERKSFNKKQDSDKYKGSTTDKKSSKEKDSRTDTNSGKKKAPSQYTNFSKRNGTDIKKAFHRSRGFIKQNASKRHPSKGTKSVRGNSGALSFGHGETRKSLSTKRSSQAPAKHR